MEMKTYVQEQLRKENIESFTSYYKNLLISPIGGGGTQTLSTSPAYVQFEIPSGVYNFSRMTLEFTLANTNASAAQSLYILPTDYCSLIQWVQMYTSNSNVYLIDLQNVDIYSKSLASVLDYKNRSKNDGFIFQSDRSGIESSQTLVINVGNDANPPVVAAVNGITPAVNVLPSNLYIVTQPDTQNNQAVTSSGYHVKCDFLTSLVAGTQTFVAGKPGNVNELSHIHYQKNVATSRFLTENYNIKLKDLLHDSFFIIDKDFYIASSMFLKIIFNTRDKILFQLSGASNAGNLAGNTINVALANAQDVTLTNIWLMSYIQANPQLEMMVRESSNKTETIIMPRVMTNSMSFAAGSTNQNTTFRVNSIFESRLYKNYYQIVDTGSTLVPNYTSNILMWATSCNDLHEELGGGAIANQWAIGRCLSYYQIYINNQLFLFHNPTKYEDYDYYKQYFKKTSLTNAKAFYNQGGIYTVFDTEPVDGENEYKLVNYKGLQMPNNEQIFQYNITSNSNAGATGTVGAPIHYLHSILLCKLYYKSGLFFTQPPL